MLVSRLGPAEFVMDDSRACLVPERLRHMERPSLWKTLPWLMDASVIPLKCSSSKFKDEAIRCEGGILCRHASSPFYS
jgi:hypothetical protein